MIGLIRLSNSDSNHLIFYYASRSNSNCQIIHLVFIFCWRLLIRLALFSRLTFPFGASKQPALNICTFREKLRFFFIKSQEPMNFLIF
ncbi:hypothetical protein EBQ24_09445 [Allofranklinella schreckenbergeri]|uniref:Uncharacterized protein n=1 Tax=Allofranklinella schreckenbergeri TaxID=1076744 RepID=A0A3M6QWB1_9BURK|nr:hypothetical protein EBQ24_09445 [Allofranklinella schreckenbergeri]